MRTLLSVLILAVSLSLASNSCAQAVDSFTAKQAATTATGEGSDTTKLIAKTKGVAWRTRTLSVNRTSTCQQSQPATLGIATPGDEALYIEARNARGRSSVTWSFEKPQRLSFDASVNVLALDITATSSRPGVAVSMRATVTAGQRKYFNHLHNITLPNDKESKTLVFAFNAPNKSGYAKREADTIRQISVSFENVVGCDATFAVKNIRLLGSLPTTNKSRQTKPAPPAKNRRDAMPDVPSPPPAPTTTPEASPIPNPCETEQARKEVAGCEKFEAKRAGTCSARRCECVPNFSTNSFSLSITSSNTETNVGKPCIDAVCEHSPGVCSDDGLCMPPQLHNANSPLFEVWEGMVFPGSKLNNGCLDRSKKLPVRDELCTMTTEDINNRIRGMIRVGAACVDFDKNSGVCNSDGSCVPSLAGEPSCNNKADCSQCSLAGEVPKRICFNNKCVTEVEAARSLCSVVKPSDPRSFCLPCVVNLTANSDGRCGESVIHTQRPGSRRGTVVNMDGIQCTQNSQTGVCQAGVCQLAPIIITTPKPAATGTPRR